MFATGRRAVSFTIVWLEQESVRAVLNSGPLILLIASLIDAYSVIVFVAAIFSWLQLPPSSQVVRIARMLTEPALAPIRRLVPPAGRLDFSPLILLVLIQILGHVLMVK